MNKKITTMVLGALVGTTMLVGTALAGGSGSMGYDAYKSAVKQTITVKNVTPQVEVAVQDKGNLIVDMKATLKVDQTNKTMSDVITDKASDPQKTVNVYKQKDQAIIKSSDSDVYNVMKNNGDQQSRDKEEQKQPDMNSAKINNAEKVIDALTGSIQNYIGSTKKQDGTQDVSLKMSENQIPAVVNALVPLAVQNMGSAKFADREMNTPFASDIQAKSPKLVDEIKIVNVDMTAKIGTDNMLINQTLNITLTGNDAAGKAHEIIVKVTMNFTNFNSTTPDTVDLTGKQVKVQDLPQHNHRG